jgi:hypothetical protein
VCGLGLLLAACATQPPESAKSVPDRDDCGMPYVSAVQPLASEGAPPSESSLKFVSLSPEPGTVTPRGARIEAELQFAIQDFAPGTYAAMLQFDTLDPGFTIHGGNGKPTPLPVAMGTVKLCVPVSVLWRKAELHWPLRVHAVMTRAYPRGSSLVVAMTPTTLFAAGERPFPTRDDDAISARNAQVHDAEMRLDSYLELNAVSAQVCAERYPALAFRLEPARALWERETTEPRAAYRVIKLRRETRQLGGLDAARESVSFIHADRLRRLRAKPDEAMRPWCDAFPDAIAAHVTDELPRLRADLDVLGADGR